MREEHWVVGQAEPKDGDNPRLPSCASCTSPIPAGDGIEAWDGKWMCASCAERLDREDTADKEDIQVGSVVEVGGRRHYRVMGMAEVETGQIEKIVVLRPVAFSDDYELYDPGAGWVEALYVPASFLRLPGVEIYKPTT